MPNPKPDPLHIKLPLRYFARKSRHVGNVVAVVSSLKHPAATILVKNVIEYAKQHVAADKHVLVIQFFMGTGFLKFMNISAEKGIELSMSLIQILMAIMDPANRFKYIDFSPLAKRHNNGQVDVLSFVHYPDLILSYLPDLIDQWKGHYHYIVIDLPPFYDPRVKDVMASANYLLVPYILNQEEVMKGGILAIREYFMQMRAIGLPMEVMGILPIFARDDIEKQKVELEEMSSTFSAELLLPSIPDFNKKSRALDKAFEKNCKILFKKLKKKVRGLSGKSLEHAAKLSNINMRPYRSIEQSFLASLRNKSAKSKLEMILNYLSGVTKLQRNRITLLDEELAQRLVKRFENSKQNIAAEKILTILDVQDIDQRNSMLNTVASSRDLSLLEAAQILGESAQKTYQKSANILMTKYRDRPSHKKKISPKKQRTSKAKL